jgi:hypothetical protein
MNCGPVACHTLAPGWQQVALLVGGRAGAQLAGCQPRPSVLMHALHCAAHAVVQCCTAARIPQVHLPSGRLQPAVQW